MSPDVTVTFFAMAPVEDAILRLRDHAVACQQRHPEICGWHVEVRPPHVNPRDPRKWQVRVVIGRATAGELVRVVAGIDLQDALDNASVWAADALRESVQRPRRPWAGSTHVPPPKGPPRPMFALSGTRFETTEAAPRISARRRAAVA